ncbi:MAG: tetratricopeptide repeat protein [Gemmatimonadales bacterium]|jgi:tetratricopeptide (TPR) repeat protein
MRRTIRHMGLCLVLGVLAAPAHPQNAADVAWRQGDLVAAKRLYAERLAADSTDEIALHRMALMLGWDGGYRESIALFDRLLELSPRNWEAAVDRARVYAWQGQTETAIDLLDAVLEQQPTYVPALQARALFQSWIGQHSAALSTYEQIGQIVPENRSIPRERARVLSWSSQLDAAIAIYDSLLRTDPSDRETRLGLARVLSWTDKLDSAASIYRTLLAVQPRDVDALQGLGRVASWAGDLVAGEQYLRMALEVRTEDVSTLAELASNLRWQGREAEALHFLERAELLAPGHGDVRAELQWVRAAVAPRANISWVYENDSDGNRVSSLMIPGAWRPAPRIELRTQGYLKNLRLVGAAPLDYSAYGVRVDGWAQLEPGWEFLLGTGVSGSSAAGTGAMERFSLKIASPRRYAVFGTISFLHEPLDASAMLVRNQVTIDMLSLDATTVSAGGVTLHGSISYAEFDGSEPNPRKAAYLGATKRINRQITLGAALRAFGFDKNLNDGYFDPDLYFLSEINGGWQNQFGKWYTTMAFAPGLQVVGKGGDLSLSGRARIGVGYRVSPGREIELTGGFSTTGLSIFGSNVGDYRYRTTSLSAGWIF